MERLKEQEGFLLRTYQAEFAKDPASHATESSRSNLMALRHTLKQMYGEAVATDPASATIGLFQSIDTRRVKA